MLTWLKHIIAGREMAELERWRVRCADCVCWFAGLPDTADRRTAATIAAHTYVGKTCGPETTAPIDDAEGFAQFERRWNAAMNAATVDEAKTILRAGDHEFVWSDPGRVDYRFLGVTGEEA